MFKTTATAPPSPLVRERIAALFGSGYKPWIVARRHNVSSAVVRTVWKHVLRLQNRPVPSSDAERAIQASIDYGASLRAVSKDSGLPLAEIRRLAGDYPVPVPALTPDEIAALRSEYEAPGATYAALASRRGLPISYVHDLLRSC